MALEFSFLPQIIKSALNGTGFTIPDDFNPSVFASFAYKHHISVMCFLPLLGADKNKYQGLLPTVLTKIILSESQMHELEIVQNALEEAGIDNQALKGSILKNDYPRPELREMSDIDMVVREEDLEKTGEILKKLGFAFTGTEEHHDVYRKGNGVMIEVHRSLYALDVDNKQKNYFLSFERAKLLPGKQHTFGFSLEDFYVYMISHTARHFYVRGCGVRNLVDIYVFMNKHGKEIDCKYIAGELEKCGLYDFEREMRELAYAWLDEKKMTAVQETLLSYLLDSGIYGCEENGIWNKYMRADALTGKESKKALHKIYYFPPVELVKDSYPWVEKHKWLLPVVWVIRGFRAMFRPKSRKRLNYISSLDNAEKVKKMQEMYHAVNLQFSTLEEE